LLNFGQVLANLLTIAYAEELSLLVLLEKSLVLTGLLQLLSQNYLKWSDHIVGGELHVECVLVLGQKHVSYLFDEIKVFLKLIVLLADLLERKHELIFKSVLLL
jgi:hypothetical protein